MEFEIVADGLSFPEGPVAIPDGSVLLVETGRGTLTRAWDGGRTEVVAQLSGGPNGAALGPDGAVYVANNGGHEREKDSGGWIERVNLATGKSERLYTACDGHPLRGPNDLVFDRQGGMWFTDMGKVAARARDLSGLFYAKPDGSMIAVGYYGHAAISFNGVGLSRDETKVYVADTYSGRLWELALEAPGKVKKTELHIPGRLAGKAKGASMFDSLAVTEAGNICVATIGLEPGVTGGITTFTPNGQRSVVDLSDWLVTNICFGGPDRRTAYITCGGNGTLVRTRWPEPGLPLNFSSY
jgi:gluconolactonase